MKIEKGGQLIKLDNPKLKSLVIHPSDSKKRTAELWINEDSLSFLSIEELLDLKDEISETLKEITT